MVGIEKVITGKVSIRQYASIEGCSISEVRRRKQAYLLDREIEGIRKGIDKLSITEQESLYGSVIKGRWWDPSRLEFHQLKILIDNGFQDPELD